MKDLTFRDWMYIIAIVGAAFVGNYRIGELEKQFSTFKAEYVPREVFDLTVRNLRLEALNDRHKEK